MTVNATIEYVTPAIAREWLARNPRNRNIIKAAVSSYKRDMLSGAWQMTGEAIKFDTDGNMIDGQHRCTAMATIEDESFAIPMMVVRGLPTDSQLVMDQGRKRTAGGQLELIGVHNASNLAASVKYLVHFDLGLFFVDSKKKVVSNGEIVNWVESHPHEVEAFNSMVKQLRKIDAQPSVMGACFLMCFMTGSEAEAYEFFERLADGHGLYRGNPIYALREQLRIWQRSGRKYEPRNYMAVTFQAWNDWMSGRERKRVTQPPKGWKVENFPMPVGGHR